MALGQCRERQRRRDLPQAEETEQQRRRLGGHPVIEVIRRQSGKPAVELHGREHHVGGEHPGDRRAPRQALAPSGVSAGRARRVRQPHGERHASGIDHAAIDGAGPPSASDSGTAPALATVEPMSMATTYSPVTRPARSARCSLTSPDSSTPASPMPAPTPMLPSTSVGRLGARRSSVPASSTMMATVIARARPTRVVSRKARKEPTPIATSEFACTSPAAPAEMPRLLRTWPSTAGYAANPARRFSEMSSTPARTTAGAAPLRSCCALTAAVWPPQPRHAHRSP